MNTVETALLAIFSSFISALIAWFTTKNKNEAEIQRVRAEADKIELDNVEKAITIWRRMAQDFVPEIELLRKEIAGLRKENVELKSQIMKLENTLHEKINTP